MILGAMLTTMTWFKRIRRRRISVSGLKIVLVILCQGMWFLSALVEKSMPEAKLKSFKLLMLAVSTKYKSMYHKVRKDLSKF